MSARPRRCTIIFYDDLGRVVGFGAHPSDLDYECWEEAREQLSAFPDATGFAIWRDTEFVYAEGEGAIDAVAINRHIALEFPPAQNRQSEAPLGG